MKKIFDSQWVFIYIFKQNRCILNDDDFYLAISNQFTNSPNHLKKHQRRVGIFHRGADNSTHPKIMILAKVAALEYICQRRRKLDSLSLLYDTFDSKYLYFITFKLKYF